MTKLITNILFVYIPIGWLVGFASFWFYLIYGVGQKLIGDPKDQLAAPLYNLGVVFILGSLYTLFLYPYLYCLLKFFIRETKPSALRFFLIWFFCILLLLSRCNEVVWFMD